jgi:hypothetical protein
VTEEEIAPVAPKPSIFKPKNNQNGLVTGAFIAALSSIFLGIFLIPSLLGISFGVGALLIAIKKSLPKKMAIISIVISVVTLIVSTVGLLFVVFANTPKPDPYIPPAYMYASYSGIAYKYNPLSNIPCDNTGKCSYEVTLFQVEAGCPNGGTFTPDMGDIMTKIPAQTGAYPFPALKVGQEYKLSVTSKSEPNARLAEQSSSPIVCNH